MTGKIKKSEIFSILLEFAFFSGTENEIFDFLEKNFSVIFSSSRIKIIRIKSKINNTQNSRKLVNWR